MTDGGRDRSSRLRVQVVNVGLVALAAVEQLPERAPLELRCECGRPGCGERISVGRREYEERARGFSRGFVAPGHESGWAVVEKNPRFSVVDLRMSAPRVLVEVLSMDGCPNREAAVELVETIGRSRGLELELRRIRVRSQRDAQRLRFLGSPTVRVDGADVEPGAEVRRDFALGCRLYADDGRPARLPRAAWIEQAFAAAQSGEIDGA